MPDDPMVSRRRLLQMMVTAGGFALVGHHGWAAPPLPITPDQVLGPFYPVTKPLDQDADLTTEPGKAGARGQVIHMMGKVLNQQGEPVSGARVEVWQANAHGRYRHERDRNPAPLDPHFAGFGVQTTDQAGRYRFKTVKPGPYPVGSDRMRPPHIHFKITSLSNRLVTQMYFPDEPLNAKDFILQSSLNPEALIALIRPPTPDLEPDSKLAVWNIVLAQR